MTQVTPEELGLLCRYMEDEDPIFPRDIVSILELRELVKRTQHSLMKLEDKIEVELLA